MHLILLCVCIEGLLIFFIGTACTLNAAGFALCYNVGYGLLASVLLPLAIARRDNAPLSAFGMKPLHARQITVLSAFVLFSVGGQLIPLMAAGAMPRFDRLPISVVPLIMTTFFEEFLFRGFMQTRLEKRFNWPVAALLAGLFFSLYHIRYPGFRSVEDLLLLFAVGLGFSIAYKLSGNNLWVAYFVNLPNAMVTYILKTEQFPTFTWASSVYGAVTIVAVALLLIAYKRFPYRRHR